MHVITELELSILINEFIMEINYHRTLPKQGLASKETKSAQDSLTVKAASLLQQKLQELSENLEVIKKAQSTKKSERPIEFYQKKIEIDQKGIGMYPVYPDLVITAFYRK